VVKFVESTTDLMAALGEAIAVGDAVAIHLHSHSIKGAAASIGAEAMRSIAAEMEASAKGGHLSDMPQLCAALGQEFATFQVVTAELARG
jgi:HPt (histidine-containing phosphotransfer) domain-containing protein